MLAWVRSCPAAILWQGLGARAASSLVEPILSESALYDNYGISTTKETKGDGAMQLTFDDPNVPPIKLIRIGGLYFVRG